MFNIKAKINQERIEKKINKTVLESGINENDIDIHLDMDTLILDILYDGNTLLDTINLMNYIDVEINRI